MSLDEVQDCTMTDIGAHEEDMGPIVEFDVVLPQISQELSSLPRPVLHVAGLFVFLIIVESSNVFREIHVDDSEALLHGPIDVGLDNISLDSCQLAVCYQQRSTPSTHQPCVMEFDSASPRIWRC